MKAVKGEKCRPETDTLCLNCANACNSGCEWSANLEPVEGWDAEPTAKGWLVKNCPEFIDDRGKRRDPQALNTEGCVLLLENMMRVLREDYLVLRGSRSVIEKFILNPANSGLFFFCDPPELVRQLRKMGREGR